MVEYEASKIPHGGENPDSWTHWDIYRAFNPLVTDNAQQAATSYAKIAQDWASAMSYFSMRINQSSTAAWSGAAAEASRAAISKYGRTAEDTTTAINAMADNVTTAVAGITGTKTGAPEPVNSVSVWNPRGWDLGLWEGSRSQSKIDEERDAARDNMKKYYVDNFASADSKIAVLPDPNPIASPLNPYTPTSGSTPNSGPSNSGSGPGNSSISGSGIGSGGQSGTGGESGASSDSSTSPSSYQSSFASNSQSTMPSSYLSGLSSNISTLPSSFTGGTGTGSGGDDGGGLGGPGANAGGGPGKSVPGTAGGPNAGTTAAARVDASTPGMAGTGGAGGAGGAGKGKSEEEKGHDLPEWLRTMENTEELLGPTPKTVPGGVIGGDYTEDPNAGA